MAGRRSAGCMRFGGCTRTRAAHGGPSLTTLISALAAGAVCGMRHGSMSDGGVVLSLMATICKCRYARNTWWGAACSCILRCRWAVAYQMARPPPRTAASYLPHAMGVTPGEISCVCREVRASPSVSRMLLCVGSYTRQGPRPLTLPPGHLSYMEYSADRSGLSPSSLT